MPAPVTPSDQRTTVPRTTTARTAVRRATVLTHRTAFSDILSTPRLSAFDVQKYFSLTEDWQQQILEALSSSQDPVVAERLTVALRGVRHLQRACNYFQDLSDARASLLQVLSTRSQPSHATGGSCSAKQDKKAATTTTQPFRSIPQRLQARPSVFTQLRQGLSTTFPPIHTNFYQLLSSSDFSEDLDASFSQRSTIKMESATTTFNKNSLDELIKEFTDKDAQPEARREPEVLNGHFHRIRLSLRMTNFSTQASPRDKLEAALRILKSQDADLCILPFKKEDGVKLPQLFNASDIPTDIAQIHKYFRFKMNPKAASSFLNGQIHVASMLDADSLVDCFHSQQLRGTFDLGKLQCQQEETALIGFLLRGSDLINRKDLTAGILQHPFWNPADGFEFVLSKQSLHAGTESATCLAVEATATKAKVASEFFEKLYDGFNTALPLGTELFYVPVIQGSLSEADRAVFVKAQNAFQASEKAITIAGFHDLEDPVRLANGTTVVTIRHLLLSLPVASNPEVKFFQGIDRQPAAKTDFLVARISSALSDQEVAMTMENLDATIRRLVHPTEYQAVFSAPGEGLRYGGYLAQFGSRRRTANVLSPKRRDHIQRLRTKMASLTAPSPSSSNAWSSPPVVIQPSRTPTAHPTPRASAPSGDSFTAVRREMATMKQDFDSFKLAVDTKIDAVDTKMDAVQGTMIKGFEDMKSILDDLLGNRTSLRNVRARMDVDVDP